jgi:hypothetical protein
MLLYQDKTLHSSYTAVFSHSTPKNHSMPIKNQKTAAVFATEAMFMVLIFSTFFLQCKVKQHYDKKPQLNKMDSLFFTAKRDYILQKDANLKM